MLCTQHCWFEIKAHLIECRHCGERATWISQDAWEEALEVIGGPPVDDADEPCTPNPHSTDEWSIDHAGDEVGKYGEPEDDELVGWQYPVMYLPAGLSAATPPLDIPCSPWHYFEELGPSTDICAWCGQRARRGCNADGEEVWEFIDHDDPCEWGYLAETILPLGRLQEPEDEEWPRHRPWSDCPF